MENGNILINVLVVLLGAGFLVLLAMSIVLVFMAVKILSSLKRITHKTEVATDNLSQTFKVVGKKLVPMVVTSIVGAVLKKKAGRKNG